MKKLFLCLLLSMPIITNTAEDFENQLINEYLNFRIRFPNNLESFNKLIDMGGEDELFFKVNNACHDGASADLDMLRDVQDGSFFKKASLNEENRLKFKELEQLSKEHGLAPVSAETYLFLLGKYSARKAGEVAQLVQSRKSFKEDMKDGPRPDKDPDSNSDTKCTCPRCSSCSSGSIRFISGSGSGFLSMLALLTALQDK